MYVKAGFVERGLRDVWEGLRVWLVVFEGCRDGGWDVKVEEVVDCAGGAVEERRAGWVCRGGW